MYYINQYFLLTELCIDFGKNTLESYDLCFRFYINQWSTSNLLVQIHNVLYLLNLRLFNMRPCALRVVNVILAVDSTRSGRPTRERIADATSRLVTKVRPDSLSPPFVIFNEPIPS